MKMKEVKFTGAFTLSICSRNSTVHFDHSQLFQNFNNRRLILHDESQMKAIFM